MQLDYGLEDLSSNLLLQHCPKYTRKVVPQFEIMKIELLFTVCSVYVTQYPLGCADSSVVYYDRVCRPIVFHQARVVKLFDEIDLRPSESTLRAPLSVAIANQILRVDTKASEKV